MQILVADFGMHTVSNDPSNRVQVRAEVFA